ncbi:MAG: hypothetical protein Ct9H300mP8_06830 [Gammaproteobacteria bacterium]|nr:MAG: hypothetical protein Ct9H300mP8_06830 [Gammaproteobacteria bacterium]
MLFARDILSRNPGAEIIFDVKCSNRLTSLINDLGGKGLMWKTGHSHIKAKLKETGALLGVSLVATFALLSVGLVLTTHFTPRRAFLNC